MQKKDAKNQKIDKDIKDFVNNSKKRFKPVYKKLSEH